MKTYESYQHLKRPTWAPPARLFGPVWTVLYILIAISFGYVGYAFFNEQISFLIVLPFILNIVFNIAFTPIQFGLKNNLLAAVDVLLVLGTLIWAIAAIYGFAHWVTFINLPYLLWVSFATVLQLTVTFMNRGQAK
ncbi:MAG TPA: TspO/MBR family protein [Candidatus Paceibacterota bacterium]